MQLRSRCSEGRALTLALSPEAVAAGFGLVHRASVISTMDEARAHLLNGHATPCWFVADEQTGGRGRHGRAWVSPPGNLYATLALTAPCDPARAPELGFVAGLALHRAVAAATGFAHPALAIKWPNDLLLDGAKVAGLLLEGTQVNGQFAVLIGFGANIVSAPSNTPYSSNFLASASASHDPSLYLSRKGRGDFGSATVPASSAPCTEMASMDCSQSPPLPSRERVRERGDATDSNAVPPDMRKAVFSALSAEWTTALSRWQANGFPPTRADWLAAAHGVGTEVRVRPPTGEIRGIMRGIDERGCLLLDTPGGQVRIDAGDLFFGD